MTRAHRRSCLAALALYAVPAVAGAVRAPVAAAQQAATQPVAATRPGEPAAAEVPPLDPQFLQSQRQQRDGSRGAYTHLPDGGSVPIEKIARLTDDGDGLLALEPGPLSGPTYQRFTAGGSPAAWMLTRTNPAMQNVVLPNGGIGPVVVSTTTLARIDLAADNDADIWSVRVSQQVPTGFTSIMGQSVRGTTTLSLYPFRRRNQAGAGQPGGAVAAKVAAGIGAVNLYVAEWQPLNPNNGAAAGQPVMIRPNGFAGAQVRSVAKVRASADSIAELRAAHVAEFRTYVVPMLAKVSDLSWLTPGAADVYAAFPDLPADPAVTAQLTALLPDLDGDVAAARDAAAERLMALGPAGALAALRTDATALSVEQRGQLGRLLAAHRRRGLPAADARQDPAFLLDALEYPDPTVRAAAKTALEAVVGQPLAFDPTLAGEPLGRAADAARIRVAEWTAAADRAAATKPSTLPAP